MPACRWPLFLIVAVAAAVLFWTSGPGWPASDRVFLDFGLSRASLAAGHWWTLMTHAFLHGSWWHGILNLAGLWVVGRHLCDRHGGVFFTAIYFAGVVGGGLAQTALIPEGILVGASGGVFALVAAAGFLWDDRMVCLRFGPWRFAAFHGSYLGWGVLLASIIFALFAPLLHAGDSLIGHACHAGAAITGSIVAGLGRAFARPVPPLVLP